MVKTTKKKKNSKIWKFDRKKIKENYYNVAKPGSFSGLSTFLNTMKTKPTKSELQEWFEQQESYTLHKPKKKKLKDLKQLYQESMIHGK